MKTPLLRASILLLSLAPAALAQTPCYVENDGGLYSDNTSMGGPALLLGVQFVAPSNLSISSMEVFTGEQSGTNTIGIWSHDAGGNQPGMDLGTGTWNMSSTNSWQGASLPAAISLVSGTTYWMVWGPRNGAQASLEAGTSLGQVYRGSFDGGMSWNGPWQSSTAHWKFRLYCGAATAPGTPYCFGDSTGASCPCSAFGAIGEGCANSGGSGVLLVGAGSAALSSDTFYLDVSGAPGAKPGLILRGALQVNGGLGSASGDGLLCTSGQSARSQVQITSAGNTTFTDFQGSPFGVWSFGAGVPTNYQFWYRDPANTCSGMGFNFSNAYEVTWLP